MVGPLLGGALYTLAHGSKGVVFSIPAVLVVFVGMAVLRIEEPESAEPQDAETGSQYGSLQLRPGGITDAASERELAMIAKGSGGDTSSLKSWDTQSRAHEEEEEESVPITRVLNDLVFSTLLMAFAFECGCTFGLEPVLAPYMHTHWGLTPFWIGVVWGGFPLSMAVLSIPVGWVADRPDVSRQQLITMGLCSMVLFLLLLAVAPHPVMIGLSMVGLGTSLSFVAVPILPELNSIVERRFGDKVFGTVAALSNGLWALGSVVGPVFMSAAVQRFGFRWAVIMDAVILVMYAVTVAVVVYVRTGSKRSGSR
eukprot:CAMPEP_0114567792 /NCGR_PEP_ID=MMETSP0114-20121206/15685_1 /TAXON_ID=31324 /ORGANISM="Goniomonas sp, Strain m" /LENGTH=310 /DNA_ID=CAMNT_0001754435 /DNA_START=47 /DNA_END=979 /DNA_ORIENTATION=+